MHAGVCKFMCEICAEVFVVSEWEMQVYVCTDVIVYLRYACMYMHSSWGWVNVEAYLYVCAYVWVSVLRGCPTAAT